MTTTRSEPAETDSPPIDKAQYGLAAVLGVIGLYTIYDASTLNVGFGDPIGPRVFPYAIGGVLVALSVILAIATSRGNRPEAESGEDIDLTIKPDWLTIAKLVGFFAFNIATVNWLGWAITGAILFAGCAWSLGSKTVLRDVIVGAVLSVGSWYFFWSVLNVQLTPGILDGIL